MGSVGFIYVFASSKHPTESMLVVQPMTCAEVDGLESVDRGEGWICVFLVLVTDVALNLRLLAKALKLGELEQLVPRRPSLVTRTLHRCVQGEMHLGLGR